MKKLESSLLNMVLVLTGAAVLMGMVLAYMNHLTTDPIAQQKEKALNEGIKAVMASSDIEVTATASQCMPGQFYLTRSVFSITHISVFVPRGA